MERRWQTDRDSWGMRVAVRVKRGTATAVFPRREVEAAFRLIRETLDVRLRQQAAALRYDRLRHAITIS
jgi:hypothetical protein